MAEHYGIGRAGGRGGGGGGGGVKGADGEEDKRKRERWRIRKKGQKVVILSGTD